MSERGPLGCTFCPDLATHWSPVEATKGGVTTQRLVDPVCTYHVDWHYPDHSVPLDEPIVWATDPRVLRYDADEVIAAFMEAIENMEP